MEEWELQNLQLPPAWREQAARLAAGRDDALIYRMWHAAQSSDSIGHFVACGIAVSRASAGSRFYLLRAGMGHAIIVASRFHITSAGGDIATKAAEVAVAAIHAIRTATTVCTPDDDTLFASVLIDFFEATDGGLYSRPSTMTRLLQIMHRICCANVGSLFVPALARGPNATAYTVPTMEGLFEIMVKAVEFLCCPGMADDADVARSLKQLLWQLAQSVRRAINDGTISDLQREHPDSRAIANAVTAWRAGSVHILSSVLAYNPLDLDGFDLSYGHWVYRTGDEFGLREQRSRHFGDGLYAAHEPSWDEREFWYDFFTEHPLPPYWPRKCLKLVGTASPPPLTNRSPPPPPPPSSPRPSNYACSWSRLPFGH